MVEYYTTLTANEILRYLRPRAQSEFDQDILFVTTSRATSGGTTLRTSRTQKMSVKKKTVQ